MKAILHIGMPKTGTSSIQNTFAAADMDNVTYFRWPHPNHGSLVASICRDDSHPYVGRFEPEELDRILEKALQDTVETASAAGADTTLISAERFYNIRPQQLAMIKAYLDTAVSEYRIIMYLREPVSFIASAFQQNVKTVQSRLNLTSTKPHYRKTIEMFDAAFGTDTMEFALFDRKSLFQGDVVQDFAQRIGVEIAPEQIRHANESLSAEALALIYYLRQNAPELNSDRPRLGRLVANLSSMKGRKFALDPALTDPIVEGLAEDLRWLETRTGIRFPEFRAGDDSVVISSEQDLIDLAESARDAVRQLVIDLAGQQTEPKLRDVTDFVLSLGSRRVRKGAGSR